MSVSFTKENFEKLKSLFENSSISKSAHNANFDIMVLKNFGIEVENLNFDTVIAASLCGRKRLGLKNLSSEILSINMTKIEELIGTGKNQKTLNLCYLRYPIFMPLQTSSANSEHLSFVAFFINLAKS